MHVGFFGTSKGGKTTAALQFCKRYSDNGRGVLVLDPVCDPAWKQHGADFATDNVDEFHRVALANRNCAIFIDESGDQKKDYRIRRYASQFRHAGYNVNYIGHRYKDVVPGVRACLQAVFLFRSPLSDCQDLADDFVDKRLLKGVDLEMGEYLFLEKGYGIRKGDIFEQVYGRNLYKERKKKC